MLACLLAAVESRAPVLILPPLYGTNLYVSYNHTDLPWYCPSSMQDDHLWVNLKLVIPPRFNCLFKLIEVFYDQETDKFVNLPGVYVSVKHWGSDEAIRWVDSGLFGRHFIESLSTMVDYFTNNGYTIQKDLFTAPYDWRFAPAGLTDDYWLKLQALIEEAYAMNENQKLTIIGYSCGGFNVQQFLTKKVTQEWKNKHIEKVIFLAPSFGGSHIVFDSLFQRYSPMIPVLRTQAVGNMIERLPCLHGHLPNVEIFGDQEMVTGPEGEPYTAADLGTLLIRHNRVTAPVVPLFNKSMSVRTTAPRDIGLPTMIIYNSGVPTRDKLIFRNGWTEKPEYETGRGDGTLHAKGIEWACEHWNHTESPVICIDLDRNDAKFRHQPIGTNPYVHEILLNATARSDWSVKPGKTHVKLPYVEVEGGNFTIRNDIRSMDIRYLDL